MKGLISHQAEIYSHSKKQPLLFEKCIGEGHPACRQSQLILKNESEPRRRRCTHKSEMSVTSYG